MATDGQNDLPGETHETAHTPEVPPTESAEPVRHVSREEFDGLKGAVDGLIQKVTEIVPADPGRDEAPGGRPWTSWGDRKRT